MTRSLSIPNSLRALLELPILALAISCTSIAAHRIRVRPAEPGPGTVPSALEETNAFMNDPVMATRFRRTGEQFFPLHKSFKAIPQCRPTT